MVNEWLIVAAMRHAEFIENRNEVSFFQLVLTGRAFKIICGEGRQDRASREKSSSIRNGKVIR
jgi:hypothetical protein